MGNWGGEIKGLDLRRPKGVAGDKPTWCSPTELSVILNIIYSVHWSKIPASVETIAKLTHNKLALWSIVTIRLILCNFSRGTFNQRLNASVSCVRISFPGVDVMCV